jgi:hypothetical protein
VKLRRLSLMVVAFAVLAGCGPSSETKARRIDPKEVPFGLLEREDRGTSPSAGP